jgi:ferredoxin
MMPNPEKKKPPVILYPEECWFCGSCVEECPRPGAISMPHPLAQNISVNWKRKDTGEYFRIGQKNPRPRIPNRYRDELRDSHIKEAMVLRRVFQAAASWSGVLPFDS